MDWRYFNKRIIDINGGGNVNKHNAKRIFRCSGTDKYIRNNNIHGNTVTVDQKIYIKPEITLEVDVSKIAIGDFIKFLSSRIALSDIAVKELPMEEIITQIYNENR